MTYTPGHTERSVGFMADRRAAVHFGFVLGELRPGQRLLDLGCGPGTMTAELAAAVAPGETVGLDVSGDQFRLGRAAADRLGVRTLALREAAVPPIPYPDNHFDVVTAHALLEHLPDPLAVLREAHRVLVPGGRVAVCTIDWGAFLLSPPEPAVAAAMQRYEALMRASGGHPNLGRSLPGLLAAAGFELQATGARFENHADRDRITGYLAATLERQAASDAAEALRGWRARSTLFAQAWVWARGCA